MKIVVIGGTGLIGSKTVALLRPRGHEVVAASPQSGVNTITGEGLEQALAGTQVVIDLANSPSFEDRAVLEFFETSERNLLPAETAAGVRHHVALSIVGIDRSDNGYFRAKVAQEKLIEASGIPYTIAARPSSWNSSAASPIQVRLETWSGFRRACSSPSRRTMLPPTSPMLRWRHRATASSRSRARNNEIVARYLRGVGDPREVVRDPEARYFGGRVEERSLVPLSDARLGRIGLDEWLRRSQAAA
jgi:hypothetical protein